MIYKSQLCGSGSDELPLEILNAESDANQDL